MTVEISRNDYFVAFFVTDAWYVVRAGGIDKLEVMMNTLARTIGFIVIASGGGVVLTGCPDAPPPPTIATGAVWCEGALNDPVCAIGGKVGWYFHLMPAVVSAAAKKSLLQSASDIELDISGSTFTYPASGQVTVTLYQGTTTLAAQQFAWTRNSDTIVLSNPTAVDAWVSGYSAVDEVRYDLVPFEVDADPGPNVISVDAVYQGQVLTSSASTFCHNPHPIPSPQLPNPCI